MSKEASYKMFHSSDDIPIVVPKRMLFFAPHPDDELLSCGGTILKYSSLGSEIIVVLVTKGLGGYAKEQDKNTIAKVREEEYKNATKNLSVDEIINLGLDEVEIKRDTVKLFTNIIRDYKPDLIFSPHVSDTHRAHRRTAMLVKEAVYHAVHGKAYGGHEKNVMPKGVYCYESPSRKFFYADSNVFVIVNISDYWEKKASIFKRVYASQGEVLERILLWAEKTARLRGDEIFCDYGEAFIPDTEYCPLKILVL
ncbi:MAG: PIG-L deacetylase family protein [Promethearchaeota archaeon]